MIYLVIFVALIWVWIIYEWVNAPNINPTKQENDSSIKPNDTNNQEI